MLVVTGVSLLADTINFVFIALLESIFDSVGGMFYSSFNTMRHVFLRFTFLECSMKAQILKWICTYSMENLTTLDIWVLISFLRLISF